MIQDHHDGHGLNETIKIEASDERNGVSHHYVFRMPPLDDIGEIAGFLQYQKGPRIDPTSTPGVTEMAVVASVIDRLRGHQASEFACRENALALTKLEEALFWMRARADNRARRGVLGTEAK